MKFYPNPTGPFCQIIMVAGKLRSSNVHQMELVCENSFLILLYRKTAAEITKEEPVIQHKNLEDYAVEGTAIMKGLIDELSSVT